MKTTIKLLIGATSLSAFSGNAHAQIIGACPSPLSPPPCIVFDYKKLADIATQVAQEKTKIQGAVDQISQINATADVFGGSLAGNSIVPPESIMGKKTDNYTIVPQGSVAEMSSNIAKVVYVGGSGTGITLDAASKGNAARNMMAQGANTNAYAVSNQACKMASQSLRKINDLEAATKKAKDFRGDWLANSQIKMESARLLAQKNYLFSTWLQQQASEAALKADSTLPPEQKNGQYSPAKPAKEADPAWGKNKLLQEIATNIQTLRNAAEVASAGIKVMDMLKGQVTDHQTSNARKNTALSNLQNGANKWVRETKKGSSTAVMQTVLSGLTNMDAQLAAIRSQPIESLSSEFARRNIDVQKMMDSDVDPRQFIGTWSDPLKYKMTLDMANNMLKGPLDPMIDGNASNDEFRRLVTSYNDARLEEAWKLQISDEAKPLIVETGNLINDEKTSMGVDLNDANAVTAEINRLVNEANTLAQEIETSTDPRAKAEAMAIKNLIQKYISGQNTNSIQTYP